MRRRWKWKWRRRSINRNKVRRYMNVDCMFLTNWTYIKCVTKKTSVNHYSPRCL